MRAWLITVGEPLPTDGTGDRLYRAGLIAQHLAQAGTEVVWWSSTLDHIRKRQRAELSTSQRIDDRQRLVLLKGRTYRKNVSLARLLNHIEIAREFRRMAPRERPPDVILCSLPTLELCDAATQYGRERGVPVVLDVRDLWPDIFVDLLPSAGRSITRHVFEPMFRMAKRACRNATAIIGISPGFVDWGLRYAGRGRGSLDRTFPMGYVSRPPAATQVEQAAKRWKSLSLQDGRLNICYFGTMSHQFDLDTVIETARRLEAQACPVRFILCGDGESRSRYETLASDLQSVVFPGWINEAEIWTLMQQCHLGLAPYTASRNYEENLPNKPIEYMSAGLPVVSSIRGYLQRVLADNKCGITYEGNNSESLAGMLSTLASDRTLVREMSVNARHLYEREFRGEAVYSQVATYLCEVAHSYRRTVRASVLAGTSP